MEILKDNAKKKYLFYCIREMILRIQHIVPAHGNLALEERIQQCFAQQVSENDH
jgi:hypothetical protein